MINISENKNSIFRSMIIVLGVGLLLIALLLGLHFGTNATRAQPSKCRVEGHGQTHCDTRNSTGDDSCTLPNNIGGTLYECAYNRVCRYEAHFNCDNGARPYCSGAYAAYVYDTGNGEGFVECYDAAGQLSGTQNCNP